MRYYANGNMVFRSPEKNRKKGTTTMGWRVCDCSASRTAHADDNARSIASVLNGTQAKRIIRGLLRQIEPGSPTEERALAAILRAEKFLREGPA